MARARRTQTEKVPDHAANPIALVTTEWMAEHLADADVVVAEVDEDAPAYQASHIPGAVGFDWRGDFQDPLRRTFLGPAGFAHLMERAGITNAHHVVVYGGSNNWFAAYAYWYFTIYGHNRVSLMDGGRWPSPCSAIRSSPAAGLTLLPPRRAVAEPTALPHGFEGRDPRCAHRRPVLRCDQPTREVLWGGTARIGGMMPLIVYTFDCPTDRWLAPGSTDSCSGVRPRSHGGPWSTTGPSDL